MTALPVGELKKIEQMGVFAITAFSSIFAVRDLISCRARAEDAAASTKCAPKHSPPGHGAEESVPRPQYVWMVIVLSDEYVDLWEALVTFFFFPVRPLPI